MGKRAAKLALNDQDGGQDAGKTDGAQVLPPKQNLALHCVKPYHVHLECLLDLFPKHVRRKSHLHGVVVFFAVQGSTFLTRLVGVLVCVQYIGSARSLTFGIGNRFFITLLQRNTCLVLRVVWVSGVCFLGCIANT